jgi:hypothetical protein
LIGNDQEAPQGKAAWQEAKRGQEGQHPQQVAAQRHQPPPASRSQETGPQGKAAPQEARQQEPGQEKGREKADDRGQEDR